MFKFFMFFTYEMAYESFVRVIKNILPFAYLVQRSAKVLVTENGQGSKRINANYKMDYNSTLSPLLQGKHDFIMKEFQDLA